MKFGLHGPADISRAVDCAVRAEQLGYDIITFADSPMLWSDHFATMALAANATSTITVGSGVTVAGLRLAPVTAAGIASVNRIAPGRVFLGLGTGTTGYSTLGHWSPVKHREFAAYVKVVRALLAGEEADFEFNGAVKPVQFLMPDRGFINVDVPIPIYLAAMGPKGQELAGEVADGVFDAWGRVSDIETLRTRLRTGAERSGRGLDDFAIWAGNNLVLLEPGEDLTADRVIDEAGVGVAIVLHEIYAAIGRVSADQAPPFVASFWDEYCSMMEAWPERTRHYRSFAGHGTYLHPEERRFITPELISMFSTIGRPEEIVETIREWESAGVTHVNVFTQPDNIEQKMEKFARLVMAKL